jgi:hypothetical protein
MGSLLNLKIVSNISFTLVETKQKPKRRPASPPTGQPPAEIGIALDRSESMYKMWGSAKQGMHSLVDKQRSIAPKSKLSLSLFSDRVIFEYRRQTMQSIYDVRLANPYGSTCLLDGLGYLIDAIAEPYDVYTIKPKVLIVLITDGNENSSRQYSLDRIQTMIEYRRNQGWQFIYLCNDNQSKDYGRSLGFEYLYRFDQNPQEMLKTMEKLGDAIKAYQMGDEDYPRLLLQ